MKRSEYLKKAFEAFNSGKISQEAYIVAIQNVDIFCEEVTESEKTDRRTSVEVRGKVENVLLLKKEKLLEMNAKYIETDELFSGYDIYEDDKGNHYAEEE